MNADITKTELEKKIQKAKQGYANTPEEILKFAFAERSLSREEVTTRFQQGLDLFTEVRRTRAEHEAAVEKHRQGLPALKQFHTESLTVARKHFGSDPKAMATFGVTSPGHSKRRRGREECEGREEEVVMVVEEVIVEREEPKRRCHHRRDGGRRRTVPGEPLQVVGSKPKQRCRRSRR